MTGVNFASYIRKLTKTNASTFTDADIILFANIAKDMFATEIKKADEELFKLEMTTDLKESVDGDLSSREYPLDLDIINLKRLEAMFDGENWIKLEEIDSTEFSSPLNEGDITDRFKNTTGSAFYDIARGSLFIYSGTISEVVDGLKLFAEIYTEDITTDKINSTSDMSITTSDVGFSIPRQFHELWARKISILFKSSKEKPIQLSDHELRFDPDFDDQIDSITNANTDRDNLMALPDDSHLQY